MTVSYVIAWFIKRTKTCLNRFMKNILPLI